LDGRRVFGISARVFQSFSRFAIADLGDKRRFTRATYFSDRLWKSAHKLPAAKILLVLLLVLVLEIRGGREDEEEDEDEDEKERCVIASQVLCRDKTADAPKPVCQYVGTTTPIHVYEIILVQRFASQNRHPARD
jgi:hypothetical protein